MLTTVYNFFADLSIGYAVKKDYLCVFYKLWMPYLCKMQY